MVRLIDRLGQAGEHFAVDENGYIYLPTQKRLEAFS
jgi:hypothetical protein